MEKDTGVIGSMAICEDCDWKNENYKNALATGARHAKSTGHTVNCEQVVSVTYNPKPK